MMFVPFEKGRGEDGAFAVKLERSLARSCGGGR